MLVRIDPIVNWGNTLETSTTYPMLINTELVTKVDRYQITFNTGMRTYVVRIFIQNGGEYYLPMEYEAGFKFVESLMSGRRVKNLPIASGSSL